MSFHIVCDSCTDLTEEDLKKGCYTLVPLTLLVDGEEIIDDETFDQADFLAKVAASKESVKSACPAPESYMEAYSKADDIYAVSYTHLRAHETELHLVCRLLLEKIFF